jgi:hypothetical protein
MSKLVLGRHAKRGSPLIAKTPTKLVSRGVSSASLAPATNPVDLYRAAGLREFQLVMSSRRSRLTPTDWTGGISLSRFNEHFAM